MVDQFEQAIEKFLIPLSKLDRHIKDSLYLLRQDGCFVFSHGYYHPTPGNLIGKIVYYPTPEGSVDIWGRRYEAMHKAWISGRHVAILNDAQIAKHFEIDSSLDPDAPRPLIGKYVLEFPLSDFVGFFDPHKSLELCQEMYPQVKTWTEQTAELLDFPSEKLGATGSLAYGKIEEQDMDFDMIFMGDLKENDRVRKKILKLSQVPSRRVIEFGRYWPIRIYHQGFLLCSFFVYQNWGDAPLTEAKLELVKEGVEGTATVTADFHNVYLPVVLELGKVKIDGEKYEQLRFISYDGSIRGDYRRGDRIWFKGRLINIKDDQGKYPALVVDIQYNIRKI